MGSRANRNKSTNFATSASFHPDVLPKIEFLLYCVINLIRGGFWEILRNPNHFVGDLSGF